MPPKHQTIGQVTVEKVMKSCYSTNLYATLQVSYQEWTLDNILQTSPILGPLRTAFFQWKILRGFVLAFSLTAVAQITNYLFEFCPHLRAAYFILHKPQLCPWKSILARVNAWSSLQQCHVISKQESHHPIHNFLCNSPRMDPWGTSWFTFRCLNTAPSAVTICDLQLRLDDSIVNAVLATPYLSSLANNSLWETTLNATDRLHNVTVSPHSYTSSHTQKGCSCWTTPSSEFMLGFTQQTI